MSELIDLADRFSELAHTGQVRKYTGEPYVVHPRAVADIVKTVTDDESMICAALLHDVVEDTPMTFDIIEYYFGDGVRQLVYWLTDISYPELGNRAKRKEVDRHHTAIAPLRAQIIKCADLINNTESITEHDKDFAVVYMKEKRLLLDLIKDDDNPLYQKAKNIADEWESGR